MMSESENPEDTQPTNVETIVRKHEVQPAPCTMIPEAEAADSAECSNCPIWSADTNITVVNFCYYFYVISLALVATASSLATILSSMHEEFLHLAACV